MNITLGIDNFVKNITASFTSDHPFFLGRIGGGETNLAKYFTELKESNPTQSSLKTAFESDLMIKLMMKIMRNYGGFYGEPNVESDFKFCEYYTSLYKSFDAATLAGPDVNSYYIKPQMTYPYNDPQKKELYDKFIQKCFIPNIPLAWYTNIEMVTPFLNAFKTFALDKKILVIGPFAQSIKAQYPNLNKLFHGYTFPSFELITYQTPITYNDNNVPYMSFPHESWFETVDIMCKDISKIDFHIALLGCSTYTLPLGAHIKSMGKKAIYMGAILQVCFGVMGSRWIDQEYYLTNKDEFIFPLETNDQVIEGKKHHYQREGFNGYF